MNSGEFLQGCRSSEPAHGLFFSSERVMGVLGTVAGPSADLVTKSMADHSQSRLVGAQQHLMAPDLTEVFCREYTEHMNRLRSERMASEAGMNAELAKIERETDRLIQAMFDGVPGPKSRTA